MPQHCPMLPNTSSILNYSFSWFAHLITSLTFLLKKQLRRSWYILNSQFNIFFYCLTQILIWTRVESQYKDFWQNLVATFRPLFTCEKGTKCGDQVLSKVFVLWFYSSWGWRRSMNKNWEYIYEKQVRTPFLKSIFNSVTAIFLLKRG